MRILLVGWAPPAAPTSGEDFYIHKVAKTLKELGHQAEIFTIMPPQSFQKQIDGELLKAEFDGLTFNILTRNSFYMYQKLFDPSKEVFDEFTQIAFLRFLNSDPSWDIIHFNSIMPLSLIEMTKAMGYYTIITLHSLYLLDTTWHLFSARKYNENKFQCLKQDDFSVESMTEEYISMYRLNDVIKEKERKALYALMKHRIDYGKYIINEVADLIVSNGAYAKYARLFYNDINVNKLRGLVLPSQSLKKYDAKTKQHILNKAKSKYQKKHKKDKIVFGFLSNFQVTKGQHILIKAASLLKDYQKKFEVRLYGNAQLNPEYKDFILDMFKEDKDLKDYVKIMGPYNHSEIDKICNELDFHINPQIWGNGPTTSYTETLEQGLMQIFVDPRDNSLIRGELEDYLIYGKIKEENEKLIKDLAIIDEFSYSKEKINYYKKYNEKFNYHSYQDKLNDLKDYIIECGNAEDLANKMKNIIDNYNNKDFYEDWYKLGGYEIEHTVDHDINTDEKYVKKIYNL